MLCLFLAGELYLVGNVAWNDWKIQNQLPLISDMETATDLRNWSGNVSLSRTVFAKGSSSLKILLSTDLYSGAGLKNMPRDWRGYQRLAFEIFNPGQDSLQLTIRINDKAHDQGGHQYSDRFNRDLKVNPGWNHFEIPLAEIESAPSTRKMDLGNMLGLGLFATNLEKPRVVFFDDFRLQ
jgi:hypothetical protein